MAADGQSKGKKDRAGTEPAEVFAHKDSSQDELEIIPTAVPRQGDGYHVADTNGDGMAAGLIGEAGKALTEDDLRRINTPRGLIQLIKSKNVDLEEVRKTLLYEQELRQLQVELVRLQRWVQSDGQRIAILVEGRDAAGKGGTIRRFTEHLNPRAMRVVALPKRPMTNAGNGTFNGISANCPIKGKSSFLTAVGTTAR